LPFTTREIERLSSASWLPAVLVFVCNWPGLLLQK
jgi:hypothetical protein